MKEREDLLLQVENLNKNKKVKILKRKSNKAQRSKQMNKTLTLQLVLDDEKIFTFIDSFSFTTYLLRFINKILRFINNWRKINY